MLTKFQLSIIKAVSTILFQDNDLKYWSRPMVSDEEYHIHNLRVVTINSDDNVYFNYGLFYREIDGEDYIAVESVERGDEYDLDNITDRTILGYIRIDRNRKCWELAQYCYEVECIIRPLGV